MVRIAVPWFLFVVALAVSSTALPSDLCYQVAWGAGSTYRRHVVRPVTAFPSEHALVTQQYCDGAQTGDPIPSSGAWSKGSSCSIVDGGSLFYAYNSPNGASSNTGFEQAETDLIYFVADENDGVYFVLVHDVAGDMTGGRTRIELFAADLIGEPVDLLLRDDHGDRFDTMQECANFGGDCYFLNTTTMHGYFHHTWAPCCTDGLVLGKLPLNDWRFNFKYHFIDGIEHFNVGNFNPDDNTMGFLELGSDAVHQFGIEVSAQYCSDYCSDLSCNECMASSQCGLCSSGGCMSKAQASECTGTFELEGCCALCAAFTDCNACVGTVGCGWSYDQGKCLSGTVEAGLCQASEWYEFFYDGSGVCSPPLGAVLDPTSNDLTVQTVYNTRVLDWCSGHGSYTWGVSLLCDCDEGWTGYDCSIECPGHAAGATCSGNGVCDREGGCLCNCGFAGTDCSQTSECLCDLAADKCYIGVETGCIQHCGNMLTDSHCSGFDVKFLEAGSDRRVAGSECVCGAGWWGAQCDQACPGVDPNSGQGEPCNGLGSCDVNTGQCTCPPCYVQATDGSCTPAPCPACQNGGACECNLMTGDMQCACLGKFSGSTCEACDCIEGTCNSISGQCDCALGFFGDVCDACGRESLCHNHGDCIFETRSCSCDPDYMGNNQHQCEFYCPPSKCSGHGTCSGATGECICEIGYVGASCDPVCDTDPCNGHACTQDPSDPKGYTCTCNSGWTGSLCDEDVDECSTNNGGCDQTCTNTDGGFVCSCDAGYTLASDGSTCNDVDECAAASVCTKTHEVCTNTAGGYTCSCASGYAYGTNGECQDVLECASSPCQNGATCVEGTAGYTCTCASGFSGTQCDEDVDECSTGACIGVHETCTNTVGSYSCACEAGYIYNSAGDCIVDDWEERCAAGTYCANDGKCSASGDKPVCSCASGWTGDTCEKDVNECDEGIHLCSHNCKNTPGSYVCLCPSMLVLASNGHDCVIDFSTSTRLNEQSTSAPASSSTESSPSTSPNSKQTTKASTKATTAKPPRFYLISESLTFNSTVCEANNQHLVLVEQLDLLSLVESEFAPVSARSHALSVVLQEATMVVEYSVYVAADELDVARSIATHVAKLITLQVQGLESTASDECNLFGTVTLLRNTDVSSQNRVTPSKETLAKTAYIATGVLGGTVILVLLIILVSRYSRRKETKFKEDASSADNAVTRLSSLRHKRKADIRFAGFGGEVFNEEAENPFSTATERPSLEWMY
eukprot:m.247154 g.247154  ORF g.247154 m.247154 type:complete len:1247 (-) comp15390_c0_seq2:449-4189(-)